MMVNRQQPSQKLDIPFLIMGILFLAMPVCEYFFPADFGGSRLLIKLISGFTIVFSLLVAIFTRFSELISRWIPLSFLTLCLWLCLSGIIRTENVQDTFYLWTMYSYWYSIFAFFYVRGIYKVENTSLFYRLLTLSLILWIPALYNSTDYIVENTFHGGVLRQNYIGYYIAAMFPFALMFKEKILKLIAFSLIILGTIYSMKRGAILALALMGFFSSLFYILFISSKSGHFKRLLTVITVWFIAFCIGWWFVQENKAAVEVRLSAGTNREAVYSMSLNAINRSSTFDLIIGHGDRQAQKANRNHFTHNDWLFILYDYGAVGVLLMLNVYVSLLVLLFKLCRLRSPLSMPLVSAIILMFCVQAYSIGLFLKTFGIITGSLGLVAGTFYGTTFSRNDTKPIEIFRP